jgi:hypothetical protein
MVEYKRRKEGEEDGWKPFIDIHGPLDLISINGVG